MNNISPEKLNQEAYDDVINLKELFGVIWNGKAIIFLITSIFAILSILYALSLPNIYRSQVLLAPSQQQDSLSSRMSSFSSLANIAGINLQGGGNSKSLQALAVLTSKNFFINNILPSIYLPDLMANPRWDSKNNSLVYDNNIFNSEEDKWVRDLDFPYQVPTPQEAYKFFSENVFIVNRDKVTGFVTMSIDHVSPFVAANWANLILDEINKQFRQEDLVVALSSIDYLNKQILETNVVEVRQALSELLQNQIQTSMLVEANNYYVYFPLDPPIPPEFKNRPTRSIIVILITFLGGIFGVLVVVVRYYFFGDIRAKQ